MKDETVEAVTLSDAKVDWEGGFEGWLRSTGRGERTIAAYQADIRLFCQWFESANGEGFAPELMNSLDVNGFGRWQMEVQRVSAATWNRRRVALRVLCEWIEESWKLPLFSFKRIPRAREQRGAHGWLGERDLGRLMRQLEVEIGAANTQERRWRATRDRAMVGVMRFAGLRVGEICGLRMEDVTISERRGVVRVVNGKGRKSREVPLCAAVREMLAGWLEVRGGSPGSVFCDESGGELTTRAVQKRLAVIGERCGIEVHPHALRHTCGKRMIDAGRPISEVMQILGHEGQMTTLRYILPGAEDLVEAVEAGELGKRARR
jgi:site-specific recombinase XerC